MPTQQFLLTSLEKNINPGFTIKQLKVENPTPFYIYINTTNAPPTNINAVYTIQPNSTFISPAIVTTDIAILSSGLDVSKGVAKLTAYSEAMQASGNTPYMTNQFVGNFPNYPFTIPASLTTPSVTLPDVSIERFQNVYFLIRADTSLGVIVTAQPYFIYVQRGINSGFVLGGYAPQGGVKYYTPTGIPETITPFVYQRGTGYEKTINVIQTNDPLDINYDVTYGSLSAIGGAVSSSVYTFVEQLGLVLTVRIGDQNTGGWVGSVTVNLYARPYDSGDEGIIYTFTFNGAIPNLSVSDYLYIIKGKIILIGTFSVIRLEITNNSIPADEFIAQVFMSPL